MGSLAMTEIDLVTLGVEDAERVQELAEYHYPESFDQELEDIETNLSGNPSETLCFGLEEDGHLVGYLMAWVRNTFIENRTEQVISIDDLVVEEGHRGSLFRLLGKLRDSAVERGLYGLPVEGFLRGDIALNITSHPKLLARLGYKFVGANVYTDQRFGEEIVFVRYELMDG